MTTVYFDNAATSYPKPSCVVRANCEGLINYSGNPSRGTHAISQKASAALFDLRARAAEFFGTSKEEHVVISQNTTHSVNMALRTLLRYGDSVLCSNIEHNAVRRVLLRLVKEKNIALHTFDALASDIDIISRFEEIIKKEKITLAVLPHASNVCSKVLPLEKLGDICRRYGTLLVVDAAQSAGHNPINFDAWGIDALCLSGHKGLYSPPGIGLLIVSDRFCDIAKKSPVLITGGAGVDSMAEDMPDVFPERFEPGTLSAPLCYSLSAGIDFVKRIGIKNITEAQCRLGNYAKNILSCHKNIIIYRPDLNGGIVSFNINGMSPERVAEYFAERGFCLRAGLHCAPEAHKSLGSLGAFGGAVRMSFGVFNTTYELDLFKDALLSIPLK